MSKTNENGITVINLILTIILMIILSAVTVTLVTNSKIIPSTKEVKNQYNQMVENKDREMDSNEVFNLFELDG